MDTMLSPRTHAGHLRFRPIGLAASSALAVTAMLAPTGGAVRAASTYVAASADRSVAPSVAPSVPSSADPGADASVAPSIAPSADPSLGPSVDPSLAPSVDPSTEPDFGGDPDPHDESNGPTGICGCPEPSATTSSTFVDPPASPYRGEVLAIAASATVTPPPTDTVAGAPADAMSSGVRGTLFVLASILAGIALAPARRRRQTADGSET